MAHSVSARKRVRQNEKANARNRWRLKSMRDSVKDLREKILHGSVPETKESFKAAVRAIDRAAGSGVIHKNTAARYKSRLSARVKSKQAAAK